MLNEKKFFERPNSIVGCYFLLGNFFAGMRAKELNNEALERTTKFSMLLDSCWLTNGNLNVSFFENVNLLCFKERIFHFYGKSKISQEIWLYLCCLFYLESMEFYSFESNPNTRLLVMTFLRWLFAALNCDEIPKNIQTDVLEDPQILFEYATKKFKNHNSDKTFRRLCVKTFCRLRTRSKEFQEFSDSAVVEWGFKLRRKNLIVGFSSLIGEKSDLEISEVVKFIRNNNEMQIWKSCLEGRNSETRLIYLKIKCMIAKYLETLWSKMQSTVANDVFRVPYNFKNVDDRIVIRLLCAKADQRKKFLVEYFQENLDLFFEFIAHGIRQYLNGARWTYGGKFEKRMNNWKSKTSNKAPESLAFYLNNTGLFITAKKSYLPAKDRIRTRITGLADLNRLFSGTNESGESLMAFEADQRTTEQESEIEVFNCEKTSEEDSDDEFPGSQSYLPSFLPGSSNNFSNQPTSDQGRESRSENHENFSRHGTIPSKIHGLGAENVVFGGNVHGKYGMRNEIGNGNVSGSGNHGKNQSSVGNGNALVKGGSGIGSRNSLANSPVSRLKALRALAEQSTNSSSQSEGSGKGFSKANNRNEVGSGSNIGSDSDSDRPKRAASEIKFTSPKRPACENETESLSRFAIQSRIASQSRITSQNASSSESKIVSQNASSSQSKSSSEKSFERKDEMQIEFQTSSEYDSDSDEVPESFEGY